MQTLINSLINGTNEYRDNGEVITHPPTATSLRAARELTTLTNINATNHQLIMQLQQRIDEQLKEILQLQAQNNEYNRELSAIKAVPSVRESEQQVSEMGSPSPEPPSSHTDGEGI